MGPICPGVVRGLAIHGEFQAEGYEGRYYSKTSHTEIRSVNDALFRLGQIVHHLRYGYRGVVVGYDPECKAADAWYALQIQGKGYEPTRQQPWYHVLVDGSNGQTYVAQQNLEPGDSRRPVDHPLIYRYFATFRDGCYHEPSWN